jgi:hypothetical protein
MLEDAPFLLQQDVFSCLDTRDFNSDHGAIISIHEAFTGIGGCASVNPAGVRSNFAIANSGCCSYSWQALKSTPLRSDVGDKQNSFRLEYYLQLS